jgi:hypothetical protein
MIMITKRSLILIILMSATATVSFRALNHEIVSAQSMAGTQYNADGSVKRFYADDSFWNTPIGSSPTLDPNSAAILAGSFIPYAGRSAFANGDDWGISLVYASPTDKVYTIPHATYYDYGPLSFAIPKGALPTTGSDHHLVVLNGNQEFDLWNAVYNKSSDTWTAGSRFIVDPTGWGANAAPGQFAGGAVAAGFSELGGVVRPEEIKQGHIDHALSIMVPTIRSGYIAAPATATDGVVNNIGAIPEGAHIQLDPSFNVDAQNWPTWEKVMAKALQTYGAYVSDHGGAVAFYGQTDMNAGNMTWASVGVPKEPSLSNLPWNLFRVLSIPTKSTGTASGPESTGTPGTPSSPGSSGALGAGTYGSGSDSLTIKVAEDAYQGDAQFTVTLDGVQLSGAYVTTASHTAGQLDSFIFKGSWGSGAHTVGLTFINDAFDATTGGDRNLYFQSGSYNGTAFGAPTTQESNGTMAFSVSATSTSGPPTAAPAESRALLGTSAADTLQTTAGATLINGLAGNDIITAGGIGNAVYGGDGDDNITLFGSRNWVDPGAGSDGITDKGGNNTFVLNKVGQGFDTIFGNVLANGDLFDLRAALAGTSWQKDVTPLSDYVHTAAWNGGQGTVISISPQGAGGASTAIALLHDTGSVSVNMFLGRAISF